jgi:uncharacterized protein (DUF1697 family)
VTHFVALLRGVNVGGKKLVAMADLRHALGVLGMAEPRSLLNSGNLLFRSEASAPELEALLERDLEKRFGLRTSIFVRSARDLKAVVARNPFVDEAQRDPGRLIAMFLKATPAAKQYAALEASIVGRERVAAGGRVAYIVYPDGAGESRLTNTVIDAKLATQCTGRNWNTVLKINALLSA